MLALLALLGQVAPAEAAVELRAGPVRAVAVDNAALAPEHRAGYNGLAELRRGEGPNVFVPAFAGLNFEHVFNGDGASYAWDIFEPRRAPMLLRRLSARRAELRQDRTEHWPLRTRIDLALQPSGAIDFEVEAMPLEDAWPRGYIGLFFASYIQAPEDGAIWFIGRSRPGKGDSKARWVKHLPPAHGEAASHRPAGSDWDPPMDPKMPIPLASGHSDLEYVYPFYYGVSHGQALVFMFDPPSSAGEVRFAQSPSGGGPGNPAWDFVLLQRRYRVGKSFRFRGRLLYLPFAGPEPIVRAYEAWSGRRVKRP